MAYEAILVDVDADGVATITLNRPESLNSWNAVMARELSEALGACDRDDAVRAVVLTGAGRCFCAGADLSSGGDTFDSERNRARAERNSDRTPQVLPYDIAKPVVAAINGHAVGVGATYPLTCDVRVAALDAKIAFVFTRRGMMPELGSHALLPRVVGLSNAADLLMSGRTITGEEAARLGLVSEAVARERVVEVARERAADIARNAAPVSVAVTKRLLWEGLGLSIAEMEARERPVFEWIGRQADAREGIESFLEKRPPDWKLSATSDFPQQFFDSMS
ncbi:MAG: enoyl-CoA hydratase-related protein [Acidimicrobiia bacterium]|nr:enoyl-CoA hydratase-related protein [Acidimicrobiia bacterium]